MDIEEELRKHKSASIYEPAYVTMEIDHEKDGIHGSFSLDDKVGWCWYGDDDEFLLGMLRVGDSQVSDKFKEELADSNITKHEIKEAIKTSLRKNPSDGLYHILGDNRNYLGFDIGDEFYDEEYEIRSCLEENGVDRDKAEEVASMITEEASWEVPDTKDIFEELEKELTKDAYRLVSKNVSWKKVVMDAIDACNTKKTASEFFDCIADELVPLKEEGMDAFYSDYMDAVYEAMSKVTHDKNKLKEIANKTGVDFKKVEKCAVPY